MRIMISLLVVLIVSTLASAQPLADRILADRIPADAIVYVGWGGTNDPGPAYAGSRLEAIARQSQVGKLIDETLPVVIKTLQQKNPSAASDLETARVILPQVIKYPTAFFFAGLAEGDQPMPKFGFITRAGNKSPELLAELQKLLAKIPPRVSAKAFTSGDVVAITFGYADDASALAEAGNGLAASDTFKLALAKVNSDPTVLVYVNVDQARQLLNGVLAKARHPQAQEIAAKVQTALDESGISGVKSIIFTGAFAGRDWEERCFIDSPAPRKGLLTLLESKPFNPDLLKRVPEGATLVQASRLDLNKAVNELRRIVTAVDPQAGDLFNKGLGAATLAIGKNFENDVLDPLGDEWIVYLAPELGGDSLTGLVLVSKVDNAMKAKLGLSSLSIFLSNTAGTLTKRQDFQLGAKLLKVDDLNLYYAATPLIAPAWTIKDGYLYAGFYPQTVVAAARYDGKSIADNPKFTETLTRLEQGNVVGLSFDDVPRTLPRAYSTGLALTRAGLGALDMFVAPAPEMVVPPLPAILKETTPAGSVVWLDDAGLHARSVAPYPGAQVLSRASLVSDLTPPLIAVLVPALGRAREAAEQVKSMSNLRQIGIGCMMYANENTGNLPPNLDALTNADYLGNKLISPFASPADADGGYVYLGVENLKIAKLKRPSETLLAYDSAAMSRTGQVIALFADGHCESRPAGSLPELLKQAREAGLKAE